LARRVGLQLYRKQLSRHIETPLRKRRGLDRIDILLASTFEEILSGLTGWLCFLITQEAQLPIVLEYQE